MFDVPQKFYELCRLCLSLDGVKISIFAEGGSQQNFAEKISACLSITVSALRFAIIRILPDATICGTLGVTVYASLRLRRSHRHRAIGLSFPLSLARSLARFRGALARALAQDGVAPICRFSLARTFSRSRSCSHSRTGDASLREYVYVRVPREKVWQEMCPRDKPTSSNGI